MTSIGIGLFFLAIGVVVAGTMISQGLYDLAKAFDNVGKGVVNEVLKPLVKEIQKNGTLKRHE